jgi:hypothetical protein
MVQVQPQSIATRPYPAPTSPKGSRLLRMLRTTDPKDIAILYLTTAFGFFMAGGLMATLMRAELAVPGLQFLSNEQYNQLFTMHGTIMLLLYATPILFGFANYIVPLQIGSPDVAFPRLNAFSYWLFLFGGLTVLAGFLTPGGAADFGWFAYTPLWDAIHSPGVGGDLWAMGLIVSGLGTILGAAAPVLVLRPPRGLHRRAAVLRHHVRGHPGVLAQAAVRLPGDGVRARRDRGAVRGGVGAPHVRHRRGAVVVLLADDLPHRRPHGHQVRQLDRHHVEGPDHLRDADAVRLRLPGDLPVRRHGPA